VVPVAGNLGSSAGYPGLDPISELLRGCGHSLKRSEVAALYFVKQ
jgi:hypothetical protein